MATRQIDRHDWQQYFDNASRQLEAANVDVEVDGLDMGAQIEAEKMALEGLTYDPKDNAFSVMLEGLEHRIPQPREIAVEEEGRALKSVEIIDADDHKHIAKLSKALELPAE